ncbi:MAG: hypothetical protein ACR2K1_07610, partial [Saprospiraceae bacterium]
MVFYNLDKIRIKIRYIKHAFQRVCSLSRPVILPVKPDGQKACPGFSRRVKNGVFLPFKENPRQSRSAGRPQKNASHYG